MNELNLLCARITDAVDNGMGTWQWGQGVALYSLVAAHKKTGDVRPLQYVENWLNQQLAKAVPGKSINTTSPLLAALKLHQISENPKYLKLCESFANWCMAEAPRSDRGAFEHSCTENVYPNQIWADTLFMGCLFLAEYGIHTNNPMYLNEAMRQFVLHYDFLGDSETALIRHGYYGDQRRKVGMLWGRGNGWFSCASAILLDLVGEDQPLRGQVLENFVAHTKGLLRFQTEDGAWRTVLDDPTTYQEATGTAAFAFALKYAVEKGHIDEKYMVNANKAYSFIKNSVDRDGTLLNSSGGTCVMETAAEYGAIPCNYSPFAQGLAILALSAL